jgi:hypothetical protein
MIAPINANGRAPDSGLRAHWCGEHPPTFGLNMGFQCGGSQGALARDARDTDTHRDVRRVSSNQRAGEGKTFTSPGMTGCGCVRDGGTMCRSMSIPTGQAPASSWLRDGKHRCLHVGNGSGPGGQGMHRDGCSAAHERRLSRLARFQCHQTPSAFQRVSAMTIGLWLEEILELPSGITKHGQATSPGTPRQAHLATPSRA